MKKTKTLYWIFTIIFSGLMIFSSLGQVMANPESNAFMDQLGFPRYFSPFIGWAKVLGVIAILIPGYPRIKEWAYAGLFFDLTGAAYAVVAAFGFHVDTLFMLVWFIFGILSYVYYHKTMSPK